jgi:hypothetical protein
MRLPGLTAESSLYQSAGRYRTTWSGGSETQVSASLTRARSGMGVARARNNGANDPAIDLCPPKCVGACEEGCRADGLSPGSCATLCERECAAYSAGIVLSCGPCVDNRQSCIYCGGVTGSVGCGSVSCGSGSCPWNTQCCDGNMCCPLDAACCHDGHGCCAAGWECASVLGVYFCI